MLQPTKTTCILSLALKYPRDISQTTLHAHSKYYGALCPALLTVSGLRAQIQCGNSQSVSDAALHALPARTRTPQRGAGSISYIPLKFHLISAGGSPELNLYAADTTLVAKAIDTINKQFLAADIQFCKSGSIDHIINDTFYNANYYTIYYHYKNIYPDTNVIHIYIPVGFGGGLTIGYSFGFASSSGTLPLGYGMNGPAVAIESSVLPTDLNGKKFVLTHELGHFFGLLHCNNYSYMTGYELANGNNSDTTGDFCRDTPAEYTDFYVDSNCVFIPSLTTTTDPNGNTLHPDPYNIMSSNVWSSKCRRLFTPNQISRIKYFHTTYLSYLDRPTCAGATAVAILATQQVGVLITPNPAMDSQQLIVNCPQPAVLRIDLYNAFGQLVQQVVQTAVEPGPTTIQTDLSSLPQGIYFYHIVVNDVMQYRKMVKL